MAHRVCIAFGIWDQRNGIKQEKGDRISIGVNKKADNSCAVAGTIDASKNILSFEIKIAEGKLFQTIKDE